MIDLVKHVDLLTLLLGVAFGAGAYSFALRMTRKQMNGLGGRVNRLAMAVVHICPADQREELMRIILGESKGH